MSDAGAFVQGFLQGPILNWLLKASLPTGAKLSLIWLQLALTLLYADWDFHLSESQMRPADLSLRGYFREASHRMGWCSSVVYSGSHQHELGSRNVVCDV